MSAANPRPMEPSMEEILASIRRIITVDDEGRARDGQTSVGEEEGREYGSVSVADAIDREPSRADRVEDLPVVTDAEDMGTAETSAAEIEPLVSGPTDVSVGRAFDLLAHTIVAGTPRPLEEVVREMLRPMLRDWLDNNLPTIVERLVRAEIERVARGGR